MSTATSTVSIATADDLRAMLHKRNDAGLDPSLAGIGATGNPFLIHLEGAYAEHEAVIVGSPWDADVEYGTGTRCDECNAANLPQITDLSFPVTILHQALIPADPNGLSG